MVRAFIIIAELIAILALAGCAVDYTSKSGNKFRFSLTATPEQLTDALDGYRK